MKKQMKGKLKQNPANVPSAGQAGITLIALIITIIVLLILATVSIRLLINNGIIEKAESAINNYKEAQIKEKIQIAVNAAKLKGLGTVEAATLEEELTNEFGENNYEVVLVGKGYIIIVKNVQYMINEDGTVGDGLQLEENNIENAGDLSKGGQYDGTTEETAYKITCIEDLVEWTNNYNKYSSKYIVLENTIDFNNISDYKDYKAKTSDINVNGKIEPLITELTTGTGFKPIASFSGTFDGKGNEIRNIYENTTGKGGLILSASGIKISNLGITGEIEAISNAGGLIAFSDESIIANVYNKCNVKSDTNIAGGIVGEGWVNSRHTVYNCYNEGSIEGRTYVGGIIGNCHGDACRTYIYNCYNKGEVNSHEYAGGIWGKLNGGGILKNCYNKGLVIGSSPGGIIGYMYGGNSIANCYNTGKIKNTVEGGCTSGIIAKRGYTTNVDTATLYYLEKSATVFNGNNTKAPNTKEYMQSQEFVDKLNEYVDNYEPAEGENVILCRWKFNQGDYPTFDN